MSDRGRVLVTGANGYIARRTVEAFLKAGYSVPGTVRSLASAKEVADGLPGYAKSLSLCRSPISPPPERSTRPSGVCQSHQQSHSSACSDSHRVSRPLPTSLPQRRSTSSIPSRSLKPPSTGRCVFWNPPIASPASRRSLSCHLWPLSRP